MDIRVNANIRKVTRRLDRVQKRQVPFATSQALNKTAFGVRERIVKDTYPDAFDVRNRRFPAVAFRVDKANKRKLVARVYDRLGRDYLARHAEGGIKRPRDGGSLAVPVGVKRTSSGAVRRQQRPRRVMQQARAFRDRIGGVLGIWRRTRNGLELLYRLVERARIRPRFAFEKDAAATARRVFPNHFRQALRKALATAKR